jgi:hypothetical protein
MKAHFSVGIVPCSKQKVWDITPNKKSVRADEAYRSKFHRLSLEYVRQRVDFSLILSAKYGLLELGSPIPGPYDVSFNAPEGRPISFEAIRRQWFSLPIAPTAEVMVLCPSAYAKIIEMALCNGQHRISYPLKGVGGWGRMHSWLGEQIDQHGL